MSKIAVTNDEFLSALSDMERALIHPCLVGELEPWITEVARATGKMARLLRVTACAQNPDIFEEIRQEDPELLQKADQIESEEEGLLDHFHHYVREVRKIERSLGTPAAEPAFRLAVPRAVDLGLQFVVEARKHQASTLTLFLESLNRDRGVVD